MVLNAVTATSIYIIILIAAIGIVWFLTHSRYRLGYIRLRRNHENLWRSAFAKEDFEKVDRALMAICDSFLIPTRYRFRIRPSDRIDAFYKRNTSLCGADTLEYVHLYDWLEDEFHIDPEKAVSKESLTVGDLVREVATPLRKISRQRL